MQKRKSQRHVNAANARWRAAEARAEAERADGIPDRPMPVDWRTTCTVDLRGAGGPLLTFEPRAGYVAWRARNEAGDVTACAALKTLLHALADDMPRMMGARNLQ